MSTERRHHARIRFDAGAQLAAAGQQASVKVLDLSLKGALVDLPFAESLEAGTPCILTIPLAGAERLITMAMEVAHVEAGHVGLLCRSIDLDSVTDLREVLRLNLGDPALLERELKALAAG